MVEEKPIDLANIYNNRVEGIIVTETIRKNDPMKPVILKDRKVVPHDLYVDENGAIYKKDSEGNWFERNGDSWGENLKRYQ